MNPSDDEVFLRFAIFEVSKLICNERNVKKHGEIFE